MTESPGPFADTNYYENNGFGDGASPANLDALLKRASRIMRADAKEYGVDLDQRIADGDLDKDLAADVCCDMVAYATASPGGIGIESYQQGGGPYQETVKYVNPVGNLSFTKVHRKRLGIMSGKAWEIDLLAGRK
ncbi:Gp19/Gp15/Gp42 family protein [Actinomycetaceae bacterium MB13-C1-2]|nr:Gp19/Gp15/Gp42 family protein [Actinomycetaceae bacterium MB13-C1-2]